MTSFLPLLQKNYPVLPLCCFHSLQCFRCLLVNLSTFKRDAFSPPEAKRSEYRLESKKTKLLTDVSPSLVVISVTKRADSVLAVKVAFDRQSGGRMEEVVDCART